MNKKINKKTKRNLNNDDNDNNGDCKLKRSKNNNDNNDDCKLKKSKNNNNDDDDDDDEEFDSDDFEIEDEEQSDDSNDDEEFSDKEISVEFSAHDPIENDFYGIRCLLKQLWLKENVNISELTELIMKETITTVLKQSFDDDDEQNDQNEQQQQQQQQQQEKQEQQQEEKQDDDNVFGVISIIPFNKYFNNKNCIKEIKKILLSYLPKEHFLYKKLNKDDNFKCVLIINERFVNLPPKISIPCYQQLLKELKQQQQSNKESDKYQFDYVLMISKFSKHDDDLIYTNGEDEIFQQFSDYQYEYSVLKQSDTNIIDWNNNDDDDDEKTFEPFRKLLLLNRKKWIETIEKLNELI